MTDHTKHVLSWAVWFAGWYLFTVSVFMPHPAYFGWGIAAIVLFVASSFMDPYVKPFVLRIFHRKERA